MSFFPYQQFAFIGILLFSGNGSLVVRSRIDLPSDRLVIFPGSSPGSAGGLPFGSNNFSGLHNLFEVVQIFMDLLLRFTTEKLRHAGSENAARRVVLQMHSYVGAAAAGSRLEPYGAPVLHLSSCEGTPSNQPILFFFGNLSIPLDALPGRASDAPVRAVIAQRIDRLDIAHESGQVLNTPPEFINCSR